MTISQIAEHAAKNGAVLIRPRERGHYDMKPMFTGSKRGWVLLDATTAGAIHAVRQALKDNPKVGKFDLIPLDKLVEFCWKHVR